MAQKDSSHLILRAIALVCALAFLPVRIYANETVRLPDVLDYELQEHTRFLSSDALMGRDVGTLGIVLARDYIAEEFKRYGLYPGGDAGSYFQGFQVIHDVRINKNNQLTLSTAQPLRLSEEWIPMGFSRSGKVEGEVVFAGYGISRKDRSYDDYIGIEAEGKIVIVLRNEPPRDNLGDSVSGPPGHSRYSSLRFKARNALKHGAKGMLLVNLQPLMEGEKELISPRRTLRRQDIGILAAQVKSEIAESWLRNYRISLRSLKGQIDREQRPSSISVPGPKVFLTVDLEKKSEPTDNVIGVLPGSDPRLKDEFIILGAHYDHVGLGHFGTRNSRTEGQIHNGADDNSSGIAVLLSVAKELSQNPDKRLRSIVFVAFSGEERGIYGSRHYVRHPAFPLPSTRVMINLDMVGRMHNQRVIVSGLNTDKRFRHLVTEIGRENGITIKSSNRIGRSDHLVFHQKKVPVLHFFTGVHDDYHQPSDIWKKLNFQGMVKIHNLVLGVIQTLASEGEQLTGHSVPEAGF